MPAKQADTQVGAVRPEQADGQAPGAARLGGRAHGWLVPGIPAAAELLIGGYQIAGPSLWRDEAATITGSQRPAGAILALVRNADAVHGPYYLLMHIVIVLGGTSETALRLPSLIAMSGAVALTAMLAKRLALASGLPAPSATGLSAGLLLAAVPLTTRYAQEARPYALTSLFAVLATYLLIRAAGSGRRSWWACYAAALTLTGLFNLFAVLLAVAHGVSLLAARRLSPASAVRASRPQPAGHASHAQAASGTAGTPANDATTGQAAVTASAASGDAGNPANGATLPAHGTNTPAGDASTAAGDTLADRHVATADAGATGPAATAHPGAAGLGGAAGGGPAEPADRMADGSPLRWLAACAVAALLLIPMAILSLRQSAQLSWVTTPDLSTLATLIRDFAGAVLLIPVVAVLAGLGCAAGRGLRRGSGLALATVALPWLVLPPVLLLAASLAHPVYVERYVVFCLPALAVLSAAGLTWLVHLTRGALRQPGAAVGWPVRAVAFGPSVLLALIMVAGLIGPQRAVRLASARTDDLRAVAATIAANERPGDAIVYLPWDTVTVGLAYPAPFLRLRDVELGSGPVASATLRGLQAPASVVAARLRGARRLWTVRWAHQLGPLRLTRADHAAIAAIGRMHLIRRWRIESVIVSLYAP